MRRKLLAGSRGSRLALVQTESVIARLKNSNPHLDVDIVKITTQGDHNRRTSLEQMGGVGIFVKELEHALLDGKIDIAVHSLKDVPTDIPDGLRLLAVTERLDPRDALVANHSLDKLPYGARIGTGSLRRSVQLHDYRPDLQLHAIRGNVDTRLRKVTGGEFDGIIVAAAALLRLGCEDRITAYLPVEHFLPAVGQGALVVETRAGDDDITEIVSGINQTEAWQCTTAERAFLGALGGGCQTPIAALATINNSVLRIDGMVADAQGHKILRASETGSPTSAKELGERLALKMFSLGAAELITNARPC